MKQFSKELGKVSITPKGDWNSSITNEKLDIVYDRRNNQAYIAKQDVPIGVDIDNREYWQPLNVSGYADNNFINLTAENENGTITAYESLEEAVATIFPINRRVGATLSFYNLNSDRLDRQAEFELWQFNSTDLANWENKDYWNNIYYNWNVFAGWYIDADALKNHVEIPNVGQYAYVGSNLNDALLYQCRTNGTWTNTGIKVRNYISVVVSGNITIGENGNWFSDGEDTGIPSTPAVDEQIDNIITKHESLSRTVQGIAVTGGASTATNITYNNDSSGLNAENAQDAIDELQSSKFDKTSILQESGTAIDKVMSQGAIKTELNKKANKADMDTELGKKANKVVRFDNAKKQYETDNKDVETANSHILEFYTDLVLSENERLVITNITSLKSNYYINISKFNSTTNSSEDVVVKQSQLIDNGITILNTIDGEHSIFILFVSNGDTSLAINNIGQGIARMPYATEHAFSLNENKTILSYIKTAAYMLAEQTRVNTELGKKFDKSSIVQESGEAEDKVMSQKAVKKALEKIEIPTYNTQKSITVWGDSITWGSAASNSNKCYAMILKSLLAQNGVGANVVNCGVGGETFQNILVRQGAFGFYLSEDITLPHDKSEIVIQTITNYILDRKFKNTWYGDDSYFGLLLQGENGRGSEAEEYKTVNPIYANGHKCKMSYNGNQQNATINLCLDEDVTNDVIIKNGTPLYCHGNSFKSDISVFSIGTNDGWTIKSNGVFDAEKSAENYINMIDLAIGKAGTSKVIICSPYGGTALRTAGVEGLKVLESALAKHFGSRFFNWREYLVNYGLSDAGLSATEQDLKDINEGKCPSSLLSDGLHPNDKGHEVIGKMLYEIMKLNGFI